MTQRSLANIYEKINPLNSGSNSRLTAKYRGRIVPGGNLSRSARNHVIPHVTQCYLSLELTVVPFQTLRLLGLQETYNY